MTTSSKDPLNSDAQNQQPILRFSSSESSTPNTMPETEEDSGEEWAECRTSSNTPDKVATVKVLLEKVHVNENSQSLIPKGLETRSDREDHSASVPPPVHESTSKCNRSKTFAGGALFGAGFPSRPPSSEDAIGLFNEEECRLPQYREASDSEWDALAERQRQKAANASRNVSAPRNVRRKETSATRSRSKVPRNPEPPTSRSTGNFYERRSDYRYEEEMDAQCLAASIRSILCIGAGSETPKNLPGLHAKFSP
ncbi:unnamed protein product [Haemonchus placei]|uniref:PAM2 domain-containing protein n=1 Tax=Haemonchus placei TaxID=6290 RepID=A0A0N4W9J5_HAEPC|nr:unnamed protein product [Haemonchus placei]